MTLQTDGENIIQSVAKHVAKDAVPVITLRTTPRYSSQSSGRVEVMNKTLAGTMRTIKGEVDKRCTTPLECTKCLLPWLVRHCAWVHTKFKNQSDGTQHITG